MDQKLQLPFLETMITQACNLSCQGCTNYSDLKHSGYVPWMDGKKQLSRWLERLDIPDFGIIGGEPLINPEWRQWIRGIRSIMPFSQIRFTTNGLLLDHAPDLLDICQEVGNIILKVTVHVHSEKIERHINEIFQHNEWESVVEHGIHRHRSVNGVRFQINRPTNFLKTYQGTYENMRPWHSDPRSAFDLCCQKTCPLLLDGRIYKCSTSGLLRSVLARFNDPNFDEWRPYIHPGITCDDSQDVLQAFVDNFGKPADICAQCPGSATGLIDHHATVRFKSRSNGR
jgi:organic radical activating enzyme